jgi:hypothetical protein
MASAAAPVTSVAVPVAMELEEAPVVAPVEASVVAPVAASVVSFDYKTNNNNIKKISFFKVNSGDKDGYKKVSLSEIETSVTVLFYHADTNGKLSIERADFEKNVEKEDTITELKKWYTEDKMQEISENEREFWKLDSIQSMSSDTGSTLNVSSSSGTPRISRDKMLTTINNYDTELLFKVYADAVVNSNKDLRPYAGDLETFAVLYLNNEKVINIWDWRVIDENKKKTRGQQRGIRQYSLEDGVVQKPYIVNDSGIYFVKVKRNDDGNPEDVTMKHDLETFFNGKNINLIIKGAHYRQVILRGSETDAKDKNDHTSSYANLPKRLMVLERGGAPDCFFWVVASVLKGVQATLDETLKLRKAVANVIRTRSGLQTDKVGLIDHIRSCSENVVKNIYDNLIKASKSSAQQGESKGD